MIEAKSPVDSLLDAVEWEAIDVEREPGVVIATHKGVLEIGSVRLRCYKLEDGRRVFATEDVRALFPGLL